jgi:FlaG/FlaF family flagellin (archaellin)
MKQKTLVIAVVVVVVIVVVIAGVYLATRGGGGGPSPSVTPTPTGASVTGASSLQYTVDITGGSSAGTYKYMAKNIGTSSMMIRAEITSSSGSFVYIVNGAQQKAWAYQNGAWTDLSSSFSTQWSSWNSTWTGYKGALVNWSGSGDWTYTNPDGSSVRIHDISVNPSLADSLFSPS